MKVCDLLKLLQKAIIKLTFKDTVIHVHLYSGLYNIGW